MTRNQILTRLLRFLRPLYGVMVISIFMRVFNMLAATALIAVSVGTVGRFVADPTNMVVLRNGALLIVGVAAAQGLFHYQEQFTGHFIAFRLLAMLRNQFYDAMVPLAPAGTMKIRTGDAVSRVINDVERIEPLYAHTIAPFFSAFIVPVVYFYVLARYFHPRLALVLVPFQLVMVLVLPLIIDFVGRRASQDWRRMTGEVNAHLTDSLQGLRETIVFNYGKRRRREIWARGEKLKTAQDRLIIADAIQRGIAELVIVGAVIALLIVGIDLVQQGELHILRDLPVVIAIGATSFAAAIGLTNAINDFNVSLISAERVFELMDQLPVVEDKTDKAPADFKPSIHFKDVQFSYERLKPAEMVYGSNLEDVATSMNGKHSTNGHGAHDDEQIQVLKGISFDVPAGSTVALVGASGAGKSTVVNLLMRFWDPASGEIKLGDHALTDYPLQDLRRKIAVVSQRTYIFNASIGENIRMGNPEATDEQVKEAARQANLADFIDSLPEGYDTPCGEMGTLLSGGQRQRVAIARALLKDAPILVLDEATSDLDLHTEREIKKAEEELMADRTTLVIAHRLSSIISADNILVLEDGEVCEQGTHTELLQKNGAYTRIFELQKDEIDTILIEEEEG